MVSMAYQYGAGSSLTTNYAYNALGQRARKWGGAATTTDFIYAPSSQLLAEGNHGQYTKYYIYFGGTLVGYISGSTLYYAHTDHLGRPEAITNASKSVVWRAEPTTFGTRNVTHSSIGAFNIGLISGILPFTQRTMLRMFKIVPDDFVRGNIGTKKKRVGTTSIETTTPKQGGTFKVIRLGLLVG